MLAPLFERFEVEEIQINLVTAKNRTIIRAKNPLLRKYIYDAVSAHFESTGIKCAAFTMDSSLEEIRDSKEYVSVGLCLDDERFNASVCTKIKYDGLAVNVE